MKFMSTLLFLLWGGADGRAETTYLYQEAGYGDRIHYETPFAAAYQGRDSMTAKSPAPSRIVHTVRAGETLYALSRRYGVGVEDIRRINQLSGNTIRIGQQLQIQAGEEESTQPVVAAPTIPIRNEPVPTPPAPMVTSSEFHLVQGGETVASLARRFGYTEERFRSFNGLGRTEQLRPGRQLRTSHCGCPPPVTPPPASAPAAPPEGSRVPLPSTYVRPSRETPLPEQVGYAVPEATSPTPIRIVVPPARPLAGEPVPTQEPPEETIVNPAPPPSYTGPQRDPRQERTVHLVKEGETLYSIARSYRMTVTRLMELNDLGPTGVIAPFQKLYVN
jgi:LysM repeat protein